MEAADRTHIGEPGLFDQITHPQSGQRSKLGRFDDDDVSSGQSGTEFPSEHQKGELMVERKHPESATPFHARQIAPERRDDSRSKG
jgi:hypothetical protein